MAGGLQAVYASGFVSFMVIVVVYRMTVFAFRLVTISFSIYYMYRLRVRSIVLICGWVIVPKLFEFRNIHQTNFAGCRPV